jgi:hypothetical protein
VVAGTILIGIEIVLSIFCHVSDHKVPSGWAINNLLIIFEIQNFAWISNLITDEGITRRKPLTRRA